MKLSIIVPVYNSEKYLKKCLNSILTQNYPDLELIIINDGSTDNSNKIISKYKELYPKKVIVINQKNHGQAYTRNKGLEIATGNLITFVDSDDYILPNTYKKMISLMLEKESDIVICDMLLEKKGQQKYLNCTNFSNIFSSTVSVCNKIFKKEIIQDQKFLEGIWYEDYNFFIKLCLKNPKVALCQEAFYVYNIHEDSTMNNNNIQKNLDIVTATEDILKNGVNNEIATTLIINHILIDAINRVNFQKSKKKRDVLGKLNNYVYKHIKNIYKTSEFKNSNWKRKIIILLNFYKLYKISNFILSLKRR